MKKIIIVVLMALCIITGGNKIAYANSSGFNVNIEGNNVKVYDVNLVMNGKKIDSGFNPYIYNDRTFVPVRVVAEHFNSEVNWFQETKTVTITNGNNIIIISIDSNKAIKNGEPIDLNPDSIPRLVLYSNGEYKTMIPLRVVSELLGYEVDWNQGNRTATINGKETPVVLSGNEITGVSKINGSTKNEQIVIKAKENLDYTSRFEDDKNSVLVEIKNAHFNIDGKQEGIINLNGVLVKSVEYSSNPENKMATLRIQLDRNVSHNVKTLKNGKELNISFTNIVTAIRPIIYEGTSAILVEGVKSSEHNLIKLKNPFRYVIDIKDATFTSSKKMEKYDISMSFVKEVRASQFVPDGNYNSNDNIVRIVLDSQGGVSDGAVKIQMQGNDMIIIPKASSESNVTNPDTTDSYKIPTNPTTGNTVDNKDAFDNVEKEPAPEPKPRKTPYSASDVVIVVDAGHGGKDPGAKTDEGDLEKEINLDIARRVEILLRNYGYTVKMTRSTDSAVNIYDRPKIANDAEAHAFISIHANSSPNKDANGIETLYSPRDLTSVKYDEQYPLAKAVHEELINATGVFNRGTKQRPDLIVLKHTEMAAVLVETGFMSNDEEILKLRSDSYRESCAIGIAKGIKKYISNVYGY